MILLKLIIGSAIGIALGFVLTYFITRRRIGLSPGIKVSDYAISSGENPDYSRWYKLENIKTNKTYMSTNTITWVYLKDGQAIVLNIFECSHLMDIFKAVKLSVSFRQSI